MGNSKRKSNRELEFTQELLDGIKRRKEGHESVRQIALSLGIPESTLRKRLQAVSYVGYIEIN
jgi:DNA-binding IclR family transcriptional regulator